MDFKNETTAQIAQKLLGKKLLINDHDLQIGGYIVETEAYVGPEDMACHSFGWKRTPRLESLYLPGGTIYIYMMHTHNMLNIVTQRAGIPEAVLIRAIQPVDHLEVMEKNRNTEGVMVCNGPGKLTKAMGITKELDGTLINEGKLVLDEKNAVYPRQIATSPRIGIPNKGKWSEAPLRFYVEGNPYVSQMPKRMMQEVTKTWK